MRPVTAGAARARAGAAARSNRPGVDSEPGLGAPAVRDQAAQEPAEEAARLPVAAWQRPIAALPRDAGEQLLASEITSAQRLARGAHSERVDARKNRHHLGFERAGLDFGE